MFKKSSLNTIYTEIIGFLCIQILSVFYAYKYYANIIGNFYIPDKEITFGFWVPLLSSWLEAFLESQHNK